MQCPHEEAIFLDGDRLLLDDVTELFDVLQSFDLALAAAPQVLNAPTVAAGIYELLPAVSAGAPEWNGGVIVVRMTAALRRFVAD